MTTQEILYKLRMIVADLEQRRRLAIAWTALDDPELVAHGRSQKIVWDDQHAVLTKLIKEIEQDSDSNDTSR